jgi:FMN phosphatase YigB (HAD superfamily)
METIDTIIFDFGDTLVVDTVRVLEERYGYKKLKPAARQYYWRALLRSETGKAPVGIFLRAVQKTMMPTHTLKAIEDFIVHTSVLPTWKLAKKLAKRYDVIILSNNQKSWPRKVSDYLGIDFLKYPFVNSARKALLCHIF